MVLSSCALLEESDAACDDDVDNDRDGRVDCADPGCFLEPGCQPCGDGRLDDGEACDDGNLTDGDGCTSRCLKDGCGDGVLDDGEACDDGNLAPGDGCSFRCEVDRCGDGRLDLSFGEECDDGNALSGDGCSGTCDREVSVSCGNGRFDPGEDCDDGNRVDEDGCSARCRAEFCGDNIRQGRRGEACDGTDTPPGTTCQFCQIVRCGNGTVEPALGEECDDGNLGIGDGCGPSCRLERCGDGFVISGEQCDDGNTRSDDGCSSTCRVERCGDGVVQRSRGELCDDPADVDCAQCVPERFCDGDLCFSVDGQQVSSGLPMGVALLRGSATAVVAASGFAEVAVFDVDEALTNPRFITLDPNFNGISAIVGADITGDLADSDDELLVGTRDGRVLRSTVTGASAALFQLGEVPIHISVDDASAVQAISVLGSTRLALATRSGPAAFTATTATVPGGPRRAIVLGGAVPTVVLARATSVAMFRKQGAELVEIGGFELGAEVIDLGALDADADGTKDLVVMTALPDELHAVIPDGNGAPVSTSVLAPSPGGDFLVVADVDNDAADDVIVGSRFGTLAIHRAAASWQRGDVLLAPLQGVRPAAVDVDGDGDVDVLLAGAAQFQPLALLLAAEGP